jgi:hypothetical protein
MEVNMLNKKILAVFFVILIINLTPAFAVEMEQVANEAESFQKESIQKMGFFSKIKFIAEGFKLIEKAKKAQKEAEKDNSSGSEIDMENAYDNMRTTYGTSEETRMKLLDYRKGKILHKDSIIPCKDTSPDNNTENNQTDIKNSPSSRGTVVLPSDFRANPPNDCLNDASKIIAILAKTGINLYIEHNQEISSDLKGHYAQLIDEKGYIRYVYVNGVNSSEVKMIDGDNKEIIMGLEEFKKDYTGIILTQTTNETSETVIKIIKNSQRQDITTKTENAQEINDNAEIKYMASLVKMKLGLILVIMGIFLAVHLGLVYLLARPEIKAIQRP